MFNKELATVAFSGQPFDAQQVIEQVLIPAADLYHNGVNDESPLTDDQFDYLCRLVKMRDPFNVFFTGVGAAVRGGKIELPFQMGSLDQVEIGDLVKWKAQCSLSPDDLLVVMAKLDGASGAALLNQADAGLRIAYSRGNGFEGADITRHLKNVIKLPKKKLADATTAVRGETIIGKQTFADVVQPKFKRSGGQDYANPRNAVAGMMNASETNPAAYPYIDYVAYQKVGVEGVDKEDQLLELEEMGFKVPWYDVVRAGDVTEAYLAQVINNLRATYEYEIDGVVVEVNDATKRSTLDPESLNPGYAMKYKVPSDENQVETEVIEVEWNASKSSYGKPRVIVKSAVLPGIIWTYATGYNARWIVDNGIGPGAIVVGQRMGDVVPNIIRVVKSVEPQMPEGPYRWNDTKVDIILEGDAVLDRVLTMQLTECARSLDIDGLREGTSEKIVKAGGYETFNEMFGAIAAWPRNWWVDLIGENGGKIYDDFHTKLSGVQLSIWLGSMPHFGRGVGKRKMKALCEGLGISTLAEFNAITHAQIITVEGFKDKTAAKILAGMAEHAVLFDKVDSIIKFKQAQAPSGDRFTGQKVVITGFRDAAIEKMIEAEGGEMQSSVSAKTTMVIAASISGSSGKLKKVHDLNASGKAKIQLMDLAMFRKQYIEQPTGGIEF